MKYSSSTVTHLPFRITNKELKSSLSVEAAIAVPIYVFVISLFLFVFRVIYAEQMIVEALGTTVREAATLVEEDNMTTRVVLEGLFRKNISTPEFVESLDIFDSEVENGIIILRARYRMKFPISFLGKREFLMENCVAEKCFNGYWESESNDSDEEEEFVYVTKTGEAYHRTTSCSYLDLSIHTCELANIKQARNLNGRNYKKCGCVKLGQTIYYITNYGEKYHGSLECRGIKRTVYKIELREVGERHPCGKCYGG